MDMAFAARGDFLAVSVVLSVRTTTGGVTFAEGAGTFVFAVEGLAAVVTVLDAGFEGEVFFTGSGLGAAGFFLGGLAFGEATGFFTATGFFGATTFFAGTPFLLTALGATAFLATTFLATTFLAATAFFAGVGFLTEATFFTTTAFLAGALAALPLVLATVALVLLLALLSLECFLDFNANLLTGWRRVR